MAPRWHSLPHCGPCLCSDGEGTTMATKKLSTPTKKTQPDARRDAQRDAFDFRDLVYRPALVELPDEFYPRWNLLHILDQGEQGACTGFGLAATVNYLLAHKHDRPLKAGERASARMLFPDGKALRPVEGRALRLVEPAWRDEGLVPPRRLRRGAVAERGHRSRRTPHPGAAGRGAQAAAGRVLPRAAQAHRRARRAARGR